jgi:HAD superfamily hydrolase (TIGR01458 family)
MCATVHRLRASRLPFLFATNTTKESRDRLVTKLRRLGFTIDTDKVFSSLVAAREVVAKQQLKPFLMVDPAALDDFRSVCDIDRPLEQCDSLVIGLAPTFFNYESLNRVFGWLLGSQKPLIAIHRSRYFQKNQGLSLGPGPFIAALEYATGIQAKVVGKPEVAFYHEAINQLGSIDPSNVAMIGDVSRILHSSLNQFLFEVSFINVRSNCFRTFEMT